MTPGERPAIRNVVFDLDGTLVDSCPGIEACLRQALEAVEPGTALPPVESLIGPPVREMIASLLLGRDADVLEAAESEFRRCYDAGGWRLTKTYEGADDALSGLTFAGLHLFVLTNKPAGPTRTILDSLQWHDRFEAVVCRDSFTPPFADKAAAMAHLLSKYRLDPSRTVMVGDSADDVHAACVNLVGFAAACWGYGAAASQPGVGFLLQRPMDLLGLLTADA